MYISLVFMEGICEMEEHRGCHRNRSLYLFSVLQNCSAITEALGISEATALNLQCVSVTGTLLETIIAKKKHINSECRP